MLFFGECVARLLVPGPLVNEAPLTALGGRWVADHGLLVTATVVPAPNARVRPGGSGVGRVAAAD
jgi:hypothetical protein